MLAEVLKRDPRNGIVGIDRKVFRFEKRGRALRLCDAEPKVFEVALVWV